MARLESVDAYLNTRTRTHDGKRTAKRPLDYYKLPGGVSQEKNENDFFQKSSKLLILQRKKADFQ